MNFKRGSGVKESLKIGILHGVKYICVESNTDYGVHGSKHVYRYNLKYIRINFEGNLLEKIKKCIKQAKYEALVNRKNPNLAFKIYMEDEIRNRMEEGRQNMFKKWIC